MNLSLVGCCAPASVATIDLVRGIVDGIVDLFAGILEHAFLTGCQGRHCAGQQQPYDPVLPSFQSAS
jgi:hypothetical protein